MRSCLILASVVFSNTGCTHVQLQRSTGLAESTLTDLQYKQVLDNVALFCKVPTAMPYFAVTSGGVVQVSDNGSLNYQFSSNPLGAAHGVSNSFFGLGSTRTVSEQWSLVPLHDPNKLQMLRCAYQVLVGYETAPCNDCEKKLKEFFAEEFGQGVVRGWFHVGRKKDVPKCACYCGHYCDTYVWVMPEGVEGLTVFTLGVIDIATVQSHVPTGQVVRTYDGNPVTGKLKSTEVKTTEPLPVKAEPDTYRGRITIPNPNQGLQFVPR
jgi:hypothetical protein